MSLKRVGAALILALGGGLWGTAWGQPAAAPTAPPDRGWTARVADLRAHLPPLREHDFPGPEATGERTARREANYAALRREQADGRWFAALVAEGGADPLAIQGRFETWAGLRRFLEELVSG